MKPRWLGIVAAVVTVGLGYWLVSQPHTSRELLLAMVAWVLGFWVASGIRGPSPAADDESDEKFDDEDDEDYHDEQDEEQDEEGYEDR